MLGNDLTVELVNGILKYVKNIDRIILYGSAARGTTEPDSDIDIALIVTVPIPPHDSDRLMDFIVDMNLKYGKVFSVIDIDNSDYRNLNDSVPFYRNVESEGIVLWAA